MREPFLKRLSGRRETERAMEREDDTLARTGSERPPPVREGIIVSTAVRLTTTDGHSFDEPDKAMEHEAYYQILRRLVKEFGWADGEETATFARALARCYRDLIPLLVELERQNEALTARIRDHQRSL